MWTWTHKTAEQFIQDPVSMIFNNKQLQKQINSKILNYFDEEQQGLIRIQLDQFIFLKEDESTENPSKKKSFNYADAVIQMFSNYLNIHHDYDMRLPLDNIYYANVMYSDKYNKKVYIMGEQHVYNQKIYPFTEWMMAYLPKSDRIIDVFFEIWYSNYDLNMNIDVSLTNFHNTFKNCIYMDNQYSDTCLYNNVRFHYIDIRYAASNTFMYSFIAIIKFFYNDRLNFIETSRYQQKCIEYMIHHKNHFTSVHSFIIHIIIPWFVTIKMHKYLNNLSPEISHVIFRELYNNVEKFLGKNPYQSLSTFLNYKIIDRGDIESEDLNTYLFISHLIDIYTISRFMKTFKDGTISNYSFIYSGAKHSMFQADLLTKLGFNSVMMFNENDLNKQSAFVFPDKIPFEWDLINS